MRPIPSRVYRMGVRFINFLFILFLAVSGWQAVAAPELTPASNSTPVAPPVEGKEIELDQQMVLYIRRGRVLVPRMLLPAGIKVAVPGNYHLSNLDFVNERGIATRSSTGFIYPLRIVDAAFPREFEPDLYISAEVVQALQGASGNFAKLEAAEPGPGFLTHFFENGQPRTGFQKRLVERFGGKLNRSVPRSELRRIDNEKWRRIFLELKSVADRTRETPKSNLMMDRHAARRWSESFELNGAIAQSGMWSIAMQTATRHGFAHAPCAEFMSEVLRQAYQRAGYRITDDFNEKRKNPLQWWNSAAVIRFSRALFFAGWAPFSAKTHKPPTGAFLFAESGMTPGHTYLAAGENGLMIVDNGSPQGRDLRTVSAETLAKMYLTGLFFVPPGIEPEPWPERLPEAIQESAGTAPSPTPTPAPAPIPKD